jgi:hypothetical protein
MIKPSWHSHSRRYRHLFTTHPELLNGTVSCGNQADGNQQQALEQFPAT